MPHAHATSQIIKENYSQIDDDDQRLSTTVEENVLVEIENLRTHPTVPAAVSRGDIKLQGWVYKFHTGEVFVYDPEKQQYVELNRDTESQS